MGVGEVRVKDKFLGRVTGRVKENVEPEARVVVEIVARKPDVWCKGRRNQIDDLWCSAGEGGGGEG
jgi:hypothetical protein